jgi:subtilisin family serine protease
MKKLLISIVVATTLMAGTANAAPKSYYEYALGLNTSHQLNYSQAMIRNYTNSNKSYKNLIDRFGTRFGHYSWFQRFVGVYEFQLAEIKKYQDLIDNASQVVTIVDTKVRVDTFVREFDGKVTTSSTTVNETENDGKFIREYAITTVTTTTPKHKHVAETTVTTKFYSDGTRATDNQTKVVSKTVTNDVKTTVDKQLITETAILIEEPVEEVIVVVEEEVIVEEPVEVVTTENGIATTNVLSVNEYNSRDDVLLSGSDAYTDAVHNVNSNTNVDYITRESGLSKYANSLGIINAPDAWARGWTGKGSTIAILDTGIDMDHTEFEGKIKGTKCFTRACSVGNETVQDKNRYSHGTHVAGIAAGNLDGNGNTGVAYDADLLIAKTAYDGGFFDFSTVDEAIAWSVQNGADVVNMSANYNVDRTYKLSLTEVNPGIWVSDDTRGRNGRTYDKLGYSNVYGDDALYGNIVEAMKGHETVLVMSAGNQRLNIAGLPSLIAIDPDVGDRVIVVGNYDARKDGLASSSNTAGTLCLDYNSTTNSCNNQKRVSDRFLLAPGQFVMSADNNGEYRTNSGTSMAAPMVSGAVAVVHQMWPHMTGANVSKLLLDTGNKDIANYNVNLHGQGLLDLAEATSPQGVVGIPTTGRVNGSKVAVNGTIAVSGGSISALNNVMVVDDYDRDFYMNANNDFAVDTRTTSATRNAQAGYSSDYYLGYASGQIVPIGNGAITLSDDSNDFALVQQFDGISFGITNESDTFLGNIADSDIMRVNGATTAYAGYNFDNGNLFGGAQIGATSLDVDSNSFLKQADTLMSYSATAGIKQTIGKSTVGFVTSIPVTIAQGNAQFAMPSSVSSTGDIEMATYNSSLATTSQEVDFGVFYNTSLNDNISFDTFLEVRTNYAGTNNDTAEAGFNLKVTF